MGKENLGEDAKDIAEKALQLVPMLKNAEEIFARHCGRAALQISKEGNRPASSKFQKLSRCNANPHDVEAAFTMSALLWQLLWRKRRYPAAKQWPEEL